MNTPKRMIVNERTHMALSPKDGRCLGAVGSNFYRAWVHPLYTPSGLTVVREFPFDHPFHNGCFVGQHPVKVGARVGNFWAAPPKRSHDDAIFVHVGRMDAPKTPDVKEEALGLKFSQNIVWRDEKDEPLLDEQRSVRLFDAGDATVCDLTSQKVAAYGALEFPQTKYGSIGIRVEPRLLKGFGGEVLGDGERRGSAEVIHEGESDYVAYENVLSHDQRFGVMMHILGEARGPWFIRDYGMALYNPTWTRSISVPEKESWTIGLRIVAYDGALNAERVKRWIEM